MNAKKKIHKFNTAEQVNRLNQFLEQEDYQSELGEAISKGPFTLEHPQHVYGHPEIIEEINNVYVDTNEHIVFFHTCLETDDLKLLYLFVKIVLRDIFGIKDPDDAVIEMLYERLNQ